MRSDTSITIVDSVIKLEFAFHVQLFQFFFKSCKLTAQMMLKELFQVVSY